MGRKKIDKIDLAAAPEGVDLGVLNMTETTGYSQVVTEFPYGDLPGSIAVKDEDEPGVPFEDIVNPPLRIGIFADRGASIPSKATPGSAAFDLAACLAAGDEVTAMYSLGPSTLRVRKDNKLYIPAGYRVLVPTGLFMDIPDFTMVNIYPRSGTSFKKGLMLTNSVAVIDSDYVQEVFVSITNNSGVTQTIEHGERIAQGILIHLGLQNGIVALTLPPQPKTTRKGGFGSTGA